MTERVAIFIDGANLFHGLIKNFNRIDLDYDKLVKKLTNDRFLIRTYYYAVLPNQADDPERYRKQQRFLDALSKKNYFTVSLGRLEKRPNGGLVEKGVDVSLATDMLELAFTNIYDTAILISGDGDFAHAVEIVQRLGKHVENVSTRGGFSNHLQCVCDVTRILDAAYLSDCWR